MKIVATIPTYNEAENIGRLIEALRNLSQPVEALVADDNSPDGTHKIVSDLSAKDAGVHLLLRMANRGRGYAGREAFIKALLMNADVIVEMDADFSHDPAFIPALLEPILAGRSDMTIGSRFISGGRDAERTLLRRLLSKISGAYVRLILGVQVSDPNSGFRAFSRKAMSAIDPETLVSAGPAIVHEVLFRTKQADLKIEEVPIIFKDRHAGASQLTVKKLIDGYIMVLRLRFFSARRRTKQ